MVAYYCVDNALYDQADARFGLADETAVSDTYFLKLDRDLFQEVTQTHPEVAWKVMELLAQRLRHTHANIVLVGHRQQREAVLDRLAGI